MGFTEGLSSLWNFGWILKSKSMTHKDLLEKFESEGGIFSIGYKAEFDYVVDHFAEYLASKLDAPIFSDPSDNIELEDTIIIKNFHTLGNSFRQMRSLLNDIRHKNVILFCPTYKGFNEDDQFLGGKEVLYMSSYVGHIKSESKDEDVRIFLKCQKQKWYVDAVEMDNIDISSFDKQGYRERQLKELLQIKERIEWI